MPVISITHFDAGDALVFTARTDDGRSGVAAVRTAMLASNARFISPLQQLMDALQSVAVTLQPMFDRLQPSAMQDEIRKQFRVIVSPKFSAAVEAIRAGRRNDLERWDRANSIPETMPFAADDRAQFRSLSDADKSHWIAKASRDQLAALIAAGPERFDDMAAPLWEVVVERHMVLAHIERSGSIADFQLKPSAEHPATIGHDMEGAERWAYEALRQFRDDRDATAEAEDVLRSVVSAAAVATQLHAFEAFDLLFPEPK